MKTAHLPSCWLRITLRELLLLTLAACLGVAWYREFRQAAPIRQAIEQLTKLPNDPQRRNGYGYGEYRGTHFMVCAMTPEGWVQYERSFMREPWTR